jgi:hypothetical protein
MTIDSNAAKPVEIIAPRKHASVCLHLRRYIPPKIDRLSNHPKVEHVAVMSIPDDCSGELRKARAVLKPGLRQETAVGKESVGYVSDKEKSGKFALLDKNEARAKLGDSCSSRLRPVISIFVVSTKVTRC